MICCQTDARPCWRAHWIMRRPMMSCETTVCTCCVPTIFTSGSLSRSHTSATMCPCRRNTPLLHLRRVLSTMQVRSKRTPAKKMWELFSGRSDLRLDDSVLLQGLCSGRLYAADAACLHPTLQLMEKDEVRLLFRIKHYLCRALQEHC